jgi:hypothetical protein
MKFDHKAPLELLYSVPEAAKQLGGVSKWSVRAWLRDSRLTRTKIGARTMISESSSASLSRGRTRGSDPP